MASGARGASGARAAGRVASATGSAIARAATLQRRTEAESARAATGKQALASHAHVQVTELSMGHYGALLHWS